jgi:hypothetical protein
MISGCSGQQALLVNSPIPSSTNISSVAEPQRSPTPSVAPVTVPSPATLTPDRVTREASENIQRSVTADSEDIAVSQTTVAYEQTANAANFLTSTAVVHVIQSTITPRVFQSFPSPDGKWQAEVILYDCARITSPDQDFPSAYELLNINTTTVETQLLACGGLGAAGLAGYFWTADSRFFYYTNASEGFPDGGYPWRRPISRFDVTSGKSETLGEAVALHDQQKIAGAQGADLVIWDLNSAAVTRFPGQLQEQAYINWIAWSPDGQSLVYLTQTNYQEAFPYPSILNRVVLDTQEKTQLLGTNDPPIIQVDWTEPNLLQLLSFGTQHRYTYDLDSKRLSPVVETTPTPGPSPTSLALRFTETPVPTYPPDPAFPANLYPPAAQFRQPVDRSGKDLHGHGCPSLPVVQVTEKPAIEMVQPVIEAVRSGDVFKIRTNSDTAYWPVTGLSLRREITSLDLRRIDIQPAVQSPQANLLDRICGTSLLRASWWANVKAEDGVSDYFFIKRLDHWFVWMSIYDYAQFQQQN